MSASRSAVIGMLVAAELLIAGLGVWAFAGSGQWFAHAYVGTATAAQATRSFAPIAAGSAPAIAIDDPESFVTVTTSTDGRVHVRDLTHVNGAFLGRRTIPPLTVKRTRDGVRIARPAYHGWDIGFVDSRRAIAVQVPSGASLAIAACSGAKVEGMTGGVAVHSQDGHIVLSDAGGSAVTLESQDGHIELRDVHAQKLSVQTQDGHVSASRVVLLGERPSASFQSLDGSIHVDGLFPAGGTYDVSTQDGHVDVALARGSDLTLSASTQDGSVRVDGNPPSGPIRVGEGTGIMQVHSQDGSVRVTTNGAQ